MNICQRKTQCKCSKQKLQKETNSYWNLKKITVIIEFCSVVMTFKNLFPNSMFVFFFQIFCVNDSAGQNAKMI